MSRLIIINKESQLDDLIRYCETTKVVSFDFETKAPGAKKKGPENRAGFQYKEDEPTILGISFQRGSSYILPLAHFESPFLKNNKWVKLLRKFSREVLENPDIIKIAHNMKFEHNWLKRYKCDIKGRLFDTMLAKYLLDEEGPHGLKEILARMIPETLGYDDEVDQLVKKHGWANIPLDKLSEYCGKDCDYTLQLYYILEPKLIKNNLYSLYRNLIMQAHRVLSKSETNGFYIDRDFLEKTIKQQKKEIDENLEKLTNHKVVRRFKKWRYRKHIKDLIENLNKEIEDIETGKKKYANPARIIKDRQEKMSRYIAGDLRTKKEQFDDINFNSPNQMIELLFTSKKGFKFNVIKYTIDSKTKKETKRPSTDESVLLELKKIDKTGFIEGLLKNRVLQKLYSTYMVGILDKLTEQNKIHSSFLIHGTVTGRMSSREPNLQNIPRDTTSSLIKKFFIPKPGYIILQIDYSQAELRVLAEWAKEKTMIEWFNTGKDIHLASACKKKGWDYDKMKAILEDENHPKNTEVKVERKHAKTINFGIVYEQSAMKLAETLEVSVTKAEQFLKEYFKNFPKIKTYIDKQHRLVKKQGYVTTWFGRKRRLPKIYSPVYGEFLEAQRHSTNAPIQGTASDFCLFSSILIEEEIQKGNLPHDMVQVATVHDSLIYYIKPEDIHYVVPIVDKICANPETKQWFGFQMKKVRMSVDFEVGVHNWGEMRKYNPETDYTKLI